MLVEARSRSASFQGILIFFKTSFDCLVLSVVNG